MQVKARQLQHTAAHIEQQKLTVMYCASGGPGLDGGTDWNSIFRARAPKNSEFAAPGYFWPVKVVNLTLTTPNQ